MQYHLSGRLHVQMADGTELEAGPGDVTSLPQGHDAWVVGDEPVVVVDWRQQLRPLRASPSSVATTPIQHERHDHGTQSTSTGTRTPPNSGSSCEAPWWTPNPRWPEAPRPPGGCSSGRG